MGLGSFGSFVWRRRLGGDSGGAAVPGKGSLRGRRFCGSWCRPAVRIGAVRDALSSADLVRGFIVAGPGSKDFGVSY